VLLSRSRHLGPVPVHLVLPTFIAQLMVSRQFGELEEDPTQEGKHSAIVSWRSDPFAGPVPAIHQTESCSSNQLRVGGFRNDRLRLGQQIIPSKEQLTVFGRMLQ
jgi:hypothetical protein